MWSLIWSAAAAWACSMEGPIDHILVENAADTVAPAVPTATVADVQRGRGGQVQANGSVMSSSCDDIGWIELALASSDDVSAPERIGYVLTLAEGGALPEGLVLSTDGMEPVRADASGVLRLSWLDGAEDDQEAFSFEVDIAALDEAGNLSDPVRLAIEDDGTGDARGSSPGGCDTAPGGGSGALVGLALAALARRRR
jgi:uncharacterized protein (TIGR03382 family)